LAYHCLDVAAVGVTLLKADVRLAARLSRATGLSRDVVVRWLPVLLALHDAGKFSHGFQALVPELFKSLHGRSDRPNYVRHGQSGFQIWSELLREGLVDAGVFARIVDGSAASNRRRLLTNLDCWMSAAAGHHGTPPADTGKTLDQLFSSSDRAAALAFATEIATLFGRDNAPHVDLPKAEDARLVSWFVAGLAVQCDWIGSNQAWFPYSEPAIPLQEYWRQRALPRARHAVSGAGIVPATPSCRLAVDDLLPSGNDPTPLQERLARLPIRKQRSLYIVEDLTGAGKTEAALILAHRLMTAGLADGLIIALPTMATANAMYERMADHYGRLFDNSAVPSLILSHSARELSDRFRQSVLAHRVPKDVGYGDDEDDASASCAAWIADDRRRAMLADVGVVTIDQAILAVLPSKFQSLRLLGLARRVLVIDEVHAHDSYMLGEVETLLRFQAALGGSAILLSATLPRRRREALVNAFAMGADLSPQVTLGSQEYPLITCYANGAVAEIAVATRRSSARSLKVSPIADEAEAFARVVAHAKAGRCVCWLRNTVADAIEAFQKLKAGALELPTSLFHARFTMTDRLAREAEVLAWFGKDSTAANRRGRVLVATQVVEQSLDLDFDALVTDLAPIDVLIQRAGRLCRHERAERPGGAPRLEVMMPEPKPDADRNWYWSMFPRAGRVYPDHGRLWLTADLLRREGALSLPEKARHLIEGVYGEELVHRIPGDLELATLEAEGGDMADRSLADAATLDLEDGYFPGTGKWDSDDRTPTRLGEERTILRLARWDGAVLRPWAKGALPWRAWRLSEVSVRRNDVSDEATQPEVIEAAVQSAKAEWPDRTYGPLLVPLVATEDEGMWRATATDRNERPVSILYDAVFGLRVERGEV